MGGLFKGQTISTKDKSFNSMRIQQSAYGLAVPLVYGTNRVSANLMWYSDFKSTAHTTTQKTGGKGGKTKTKTTTYTYSASLILGLCGTTIQKVGKIWREKEQLVDKIESGVTISPIDQLEFELYKGTQTQGVWPYLTSKHPTQALNYRGIAYVAAANFELGGDPSLSNHNFEVVSDIIFKGKNLFNKAEIVAGEYFSPSALKIIASSVYRRSGFIPVTAGKTYTLSGNLSGSSQIAWYATEDKSTSAISNSTSRTAIAPAGANFAVFNITNTGAQDTTYDSTTQLEEGSVATSYSSYLGGIHDANPADVIRDILENVHYGAAPGKIQGDYSQMYQYCGAANLLISPVFSEQRPAFEIVNEIAEAVNCEVVPVPGGMIKIIPYADIPISGNGLVYTPNLTPVYHLTDDDFLEPVKVKRKRQSDSFNHVKVEYINRYNQYNNDIAEVKDQANIETFGLNTQDTIKLNMFCEPEIANQAAQLLLQKNIYVLNTYEFDLSFKYCLLEPMDIVTITDSSLGLNQFPVRIKKIKEDQDGVLSIEADELALGSRTARSYTFQESGGYQGVESDPGNAFAPVIFEPPMDVTQGENQIFIAVAGGSNWGGCNVWASMDGASYEIIGTVNGSARYGELTAAITANDDNLTVQLNTNSQILSGTIAEALAQNTLSMVGNEFFNYTTSELMGEGRYKLSGLYRSDYGFPEAHAVNEPYVRIDKAIFKYPYNPKFYLNKQLYFKFTSFNGLQQNEQSLDEVAAYTYTVTGGILSAVIVTLQEAFTGKNFTINWSLASGATAYLVEVLLNGVVKRSATVTAATFTYDIDQATADGLGRSYTLRVTPKSGTTSGAAATLNVTNPVPPSVTNVSLSSTLNSVTASWLPSTVPDFKDYVAWISTTPMSAAQALAKTPNYVGTNPNCIFSNLQDSTRYYVRIAARDVWAAADWNVSAEINITTASQ